MRASWFATSIFQRVKSELSSAPAHIGTMIAQRSTKWADRIISSEIELTHFAFEFFCALPGVFSFPEKPYHSCKDLTDPRMIKDQ